MAKVYLRVTYSVAGIWKTTVGKVGEYLELWVFDSMDEFDRKWSALMNHPQLQETFRVTGPMVHDERFALLRSLFEGPNDHSDISGTMSLQ